MDPAPQTKESCWDDLSKNPNKQSVGKSTIGVLMEGLEDPEVFSVENYLKEAIPL